MAVTGTPAEKFIVEYQTVFTVDKTSATAVAKEADRLLAKIGSQDTRYTSIVNKLKEMAGPQGAQGYTDQMGKAGKKAEEVATQVESINARKKRGYKELQSSAAKLVRLQQELKVELVILDKVQASITSGVRAEAKARADSAAAAGRLQRGTTVPLPKSMVDANLVAKEKARLDKMSLLANDKSLQTSREQLSIDQESNSISMNNAKLSNKQLQADRNSLAINKEIDKTERQILMTNNKTIQAKKTKLAIATAVTREVRTQALQNSKIVQDAKKVTAVQSELLRIEKQLALETNKDVQAARTKLALQHQINAAKMKEAKAAAHFPREQKYSMGTGGTSTFLHKIGTTAQYTTAAALIFAVTGALREGAAAVLEYDKAYRTLSAVIEGLTLPAAEALETQLIGLGVAYGGSIQSINEAAILLGRAGIAHEKLTKATEITIKLAKLTGDTLEVSSGAMISYIEVFGKAGETVESLGDKLAFMANESRLSTLDIETFSNYALAAASAAGLTVDAVSALATEFSKAGVNASTIGTQIRSLTKTFLDTSKGTKNFFRELGMIQANFQAELAAGGARSNEALLALSKNLAGLTREEFNRITSQMNILQRNSLALLRQQSEGIAKDIKTLTDNTHDGIKAADKILESHVVTWEKFKTAIANSVIEFEKQSQVGQFFYDTLKIINAAMTDEEGAAERMMRILTNQNKIKKQTIILEAARLTLSKSTTKEEKLAALDAIELQQEKIAVLTKVHEKLTGVNKASSEAYLGNKKEVTARIAFLKKEIAIYTELARAKQEQKDEGGKAEELDPYIKGATFRVNEYTIALKTNEKALEAMDTAAKEIKGVEIAPLNVTAKDIDAITKAYLEFIKMGDLGTAQEFRPFKQINTQIKVQENLINKMIGKFKGAEEALRGIDIAPQTSEAALKTNLQIHEKITDEITGQANLSGPDLEASIAKVQFLREILEIENIIAGHTTAKTKILNSELTVLDQNIARRNTLEQIAAKGLGTSRLQLIDQNDKVAVAMEQMRIAQAITDVSWFNAETDKSSVQSKKDQLAADKAALNVAKVRQQVELSQQVNFDKRASALAKEKDAVTFVIGLEKQRRDLDTSHADRLIAIENEAAQFKLNSEQKQALIDKENALYMKQVAHIEEVTVVTSQSLDAFSSSMVTLLTNTSMKIHDSRAVWEGLQSTITQTILQLLVLEPIINQIKAALDSAGGSGTNWLMKLVSMGASSYSGSSGGTEYGFGDDTVINAKGGVYNSGNKLTAFASGGVVQSPTLFPMSGSSTGLMGEEGPEAIVPLTRVKGGDLGVKAQQPIVNVEVINNAGAEVAVQQDEAGKMQIIIDSVTNSIASGIARGTSPVGESIQATYGVTR